MTLDSKGPDSRRAPHKPGQSPRRIQFAPEGGCIPESAPEHKRVLTGFVATLTPEQRAAAMSYCGEDHHGPPAHKAHPDGVET